MRYGRYGTSYFLMRLGLGLIFAWLGLSVLRQPEVWLGFVPQNVPGGFSREIVLQISGVFDIVIGLLFFLDHLPKTTAALATVYIAAILTTQGITTALAYGSGLLGTSLALLFWPHHRRGVMQRYIFFWRRRSSSREEGE